MHQRTIQIEPQVLEHAFPRFGQGDKLLHQRWPAKAPGFSQTCGKTSGLKRICRLTCFSVDSHQKQTRKAGPTPGLAIGPQAVAGEISELKLCESREAGRRLHHEPPATANAMMEPRKPKPGSIAHEWIGQQVVQCVFPTNMSWQKSFKSRSSRSEFSVCLRGTPAGQVRGAAPWSKLPSTRFQG